MTMATLHEVNACPGSGRFELSIVGDLDISVLSDLARHLDVLAGSDPAWITINLSGCRYLDAQVAAFLLDSQRRFACLGARLSLLGCSPESLRLLALVEEAGRRLPEASPDLGRVA